jgi:hypothetical protein
MVVYDLLRDGNTSKKLRVQASRPKTAKALLKAYAKSHPLDADVQLCWSDGYPITASQVVFGGDDDAPVRVHVVAREEPPPEPEPEPEPEPDVPEPEPEPVPPPERDVARDATELRAFLAAARREARAPEPEPESDPEPENPEWEPEELLPVLEYDHLFPELEEEEEEAPEDQPEEDEPKANIPRSRDLVARALELAHASRTPHAIVAVEQFGLDGSQSLAEVQQLLLKRGDPVNAAALPFHSKGVLDRGVVARVVGAYGRIRGGDRKKQQWAAACAGADDLMKVARLLHAAPQGARALALHPIFGPDAGLVAAKLDELREALAFRIAKEASRVSCARERLTLLRRPRRTDEAAKAFAQAGPTRVANALRRDGFYVMDGALAACDAAALRDLFEAELDAGAWGAPKRDPCNPGVFTRNVLVSVAAMNAPDGERAAARRAMALLAGCAYELEQVLPHLKLAVPPDSMAAAYPPGVSYRSHYDWFADELSNDREVTLLLYANPGWTEADGGALSVEKPGGARVEISPVAGRLVVFLSRLVKHEIRPNAGKRRRLTVQLWLDRAPATFTEAKTFLDDLEDPLAFDPDT